MTMNNTLFSTVICMAIGVVVAFFGVNYLGSAREFGLCVAIAVVVNVAVVLWR